MGTGWSRMTSVGQHVSPPHSLSSSSRLVQACYCGDGRFQVEAKAQNWHHVTSATLYWPKQVSSRTRTRVRGARHLGHKF